MTVALGIILMVNFIACGNEAPITEPSEFAQAHDFYARMQNEKDSNPTRMEARINRKEQYGIVGEITKIEDEKVQFHIEETELGKDKYIECKFPGKNHVLSLNRGQCGPSFRKA